MASQEMRGLRSRLRDWIRWLRDERRSSPHTVDAYTRDLAGFLTFIAGHLGASPTLGRIGNACRTGFSRLARAPIE